MSDRKLTVSFGSGEKLPKNAQLARITSVQELSWQALADLLTKAPSVTEDKSSAGWYCAAEFSPRHRDSDNFVARHCLALDYDHIPKTAVQGLREAFKPWAHAMYTTASHTAAAPRLRVVMPLDRPATSDEFCAVSRWVAGTAGIELASRESHVPAQMMYLPTVKPGGVFKAAQHGGPWLSVDGVLGEYADWTDKSSWPRRKDQDGVTAGKGEDPREKPGVIGAFCRAFGITEAIDRFDLPFERVR